LLADELECTVSGVLMDGLVLVADESERIAGLLLGAARLCMPTLLVPVRGSASVPADSIERLHDPLETLADEVLGSRRSPHGHGEGDSYAEHAVACLAEVMGLTMPHASTAPTGSVEQMRLAFEAGQRAVGLVKQNLGIQRVLLISAFSNAIRADAVMGGWPETLLFLLALAQEAGVKLTWGTLSEIGQETPQMCRLPGGKGQGLRHFRAAGGWPAVFSALRGKWMPHPMASGRGVNELSRSASVKDGTVIRVKKPYRAEGGIVFLKGNLAPLGAAFTPSADLSAKLFPFSGPARVFDSREAALDALSHKKIKRGDALVIRHEGPKAAKGLRPMALVGIELTAQGLAGSVPVITDGRWGFPIDAVSAVGLVSPEAAVGSPLSVLKDGDVVHIDPALGRLDVHVTEMDLKLRLARWKAPLAPLEGGYIARHARQVGSALEGAVLK
ncbi:MAG: dihydroxy-acid dehydratase, partial [Elusimicrobia bacterium]|nr:dihydroxy-acid dehydratase [Elusimicrobiota bacterium]